ncbi:MAG: hypothetical protein WCH35_18140 [Comamonadaceae bacterium]
MSILKFLWSAGRSAYLAVGRNSNRQEQRDFETYLCHAQSFAELEYRQRNWMASR